MKKFILLCATILSATIFSQEIDSNLIKNLSQEQIERLKEINLQQSNQISLPKERNEETLVNDEKFTKSQPSKKFGYDYFSKVPTSISTAADIPLPGEYRLSIGDIVEIIFTGSRNEMFNLSVQLDGSIFIPKVGSLFVAGEKLNDVRQRVINLINVNYVGVSVDLTLKELSAKKISIVGAVKYPGTYTVNPFTTISNALAYSGGVMEYGSLRNIKLIKPNGDITDFDLYELLINGQRKNDVTIHSGDTILVPGTDKFLNVTGSVIRPFIYEYKENDSYKDLINYALGFTSGANRDNISVVHKQDDMITSKIVSINELIDSTDLIELFIGSTSSREMKGVFVDGYAVTNGYFSADKISMKEFLNELNFTNDIYPFYAIYEYSTNLGFNKNIKTFSLSDEATYSDYDIYENSKITFFDRNQIETISRNIDLDENNLNLSSIRDEGVDFSLELRKDDLIQLSIHDQDYFIPISGRITPSQLHAYFGIEEKTAFARTSAVTNDETISDAYETILDSSNLVAISIPSSERKLIEVEIVGEVLNPGKFVISTSTSLDQLYILAGNLTENSYEDGIVVTRVDTKESQKKALIEARTVLADSLLQKSASIGGDGVNEINSVINLADSIEPSGRIAGNFFPGSETTRNFVLKDGDKIFIPSKPLSVTVQGEVLNSSSFIFDESRNSPDFYIKAAGGFTSYADSSALFVIKADGRAIKINRNIFMGNQAIISAGDTIIVPRDLDQLEGLPLIQAATRIISDIAFSAASLNAIKN